MKGKRKKKKKMQPPRLRDEAASFYPAVEYSLYRVGPRVHRMLSLLEYQTGQKRMTLLLFVVAMLSLYMVLGKNAPFVCNLVLFCMAAYSSFRNIEVSTKDEDCRWIVFWLVFGLFNLADYFVDSIRQHFPVFWLFKLLFLSWCLLPTSRNGVTVIYFHLLQPLFLGSEDDLRAYAGLRRPLEVHQDQQRMLPSQSLKRTSATNSLGLQDVTKAPQDLAWRIAQDTEPTESERHFVPAMASIPVWPTSHSVKPTSGSLEAPAEPGHQASCCERDCNTQGWQGQRGVQAN